MDWLWEYFPQESLLVASTMTVLIDHLWGGYQIDIDHVCNIQIAKGMIAELHDQLAFENRVLFWLPLPLRKTLQEHKYTTKDCIFLNGRTR